MTTGTPNDSSTSRPVRNRSRNPLLPLLMVGAACALVWAGLVYVPQLVGGGRSGAETGVLTYEASRGPLQVTVTAQGNVESTSNVEVKCRVAGGSTILWIVEDGKVVEEGDEIIRLDTSGIDENLNAQRIVFEKAKAAEIQARETLEAAKISVREYEEGTFIELLKQAEADIQIALENLRSAENQLKYSKRMARKGFVSSLQREADEFAVERAKLDLDTAKTRRKVLVEFTKIKTLKDLVAAREAAAAGLRSEEASLQLEEVRLRKLNDQLKHCVVYAPKRGMVVYANNARRSRYGGSSADIEEGATVRESQALVRLPDLSSMQVKVTVHESRVDEIRPGMPARIVIQDEEYRGKVLSVANQPERTSWFSANVKEYATNVSIEDDSHGLRPGMTAQVTILAHDAEDALTVPVSSVVEQGGKFYCWVKADSGPERRAVILGRTNDKLIQIQDGILEGETVLRNPRAVVEDARRTDSFELAARDSDFGATSDSPQGDQVEAVGKVRDAGVARATQPLDDKPPRGSDPRPKGREGKESDGGRSGRRGSFNLMSFDGDGDGKLSREELPERMRDRMDRFDSNGDGFVDRAEIAALKRRWSGGGGAGGQRGGDKAAGSEGAPR